MPVIPQLDQKLAGLKKLGLLCAAAGGALALAGYFLDRANFHASWLIAFLYWIGISLGCLPVICIHHLTGGQWGFAVRRIMENAVRLLPFFLLLLLPVLFNLKEIYLWADPAVTAHDKLLQQKQLYLNPSFFILRALIYFLIWGVLSALLNRVSRTLNSAADRVQVLSGAGLILFGLTASFAAIDWAMSLEPHWYSTIYGLIFISGQALSGLAFAAFTAVLFADRKPFSVILTPARAHDLGNLIFAFTLLWAYMNLSQFIIIWSGNLPEETPWYLKRFAGGWLWISNFIVVFHFVIPFFLLLNRHLKRNYAGLKAVTVLLLIMQWVDLLWRVKPAFAHAAPLHWLDLACWLAVGGFWLAGLSHFLAGSALTLEDDPALETEHA